MNLFKTPRPMHAEKDLMLLLNCIQTAVTVACIDSNDPDWDLDFYFTGFCHNGRIEVMPRALVPGTPDGLKAAIRIMTSDPERIPHAVFTAVAGYALDHDTHQRTGEVINIAVENEQKNWVCATASLIRCPDAYPTLAWGYATSSFRNHTRGGTLSEYYP